MPFGRTVCRQWLHELNWISTVEELNAVKVRFVPVKKKECLQGIEPVFVSSGFAIGDEILTCYIPKETSVKKHGSALQQLTQRREKNGY